MKYPNINLYQVLGIRPDIPQDELKTVYRSRLHQFHPDKWNEVTELDFNPICQEINLAYSILNDLSQRSAYDQHLAHLKRDDIKESETAKLERKLEQLCGDTLGISKYRQTDKAPALYDNNFFTSTLGKALSCKADPFSSLRDEDSNY